MAKDLRAAKRYATALFNAAVATNKDAIVEADMTELLKLLKAAPAFAQMWESPLVSDEEKKASLTKALANKIDPLTFRFLNLLIEKKREVILFAVDFELRQLADSSRHLVRAEATFAVAPTSVETDALKKSLQTRTGETVELTYNVDPEILGGVVVKLRDTIIDGSVRGRLERLRETLLQET